MRPMGASDVSESSQGSSGAEAELAGRNPLRSEETMKNKFAVGLFFLLFCVAGTPATAAAQNVSFIARRDFPVDASFPTSVAVGDFNGDGVPDLAVAERLFGGVLVFLGTGDGNFQPPAQEFLGTGRPQSVP